MADQVSISFTGLTAVRGVDFSLTRGITPSIGIVYALPQDNVDVSNGTLTITGGPYTVSFSGCAVASGPIHKSVSKWPIQAFLFVDKRWKWRFSNVSGDWNRRLSDGTVDTATAQSPAALAGLLLSALGEAGYDTSRMPSSVKPRCLWKNQRADLALQDLCDKCACEVVINTQTGNVEIWPSGLGITAPTNSGEILPKYRYVPRTGVPSVIRVIGGPSLFQSRLKLSAVTRNRTSGQQKLITNSEFKPSTGWDKESPWSFPGVTDSNNNVLAFEEVWREFRVVGQFDGTIQPPSCASPVSSIDQYQLQDYLLETETDLEGYKRNLPCYLDGDYYAYTDLPNNTSSARYTGSFTLNIGRRVVTLPYPLFKLDASGGYAEPALYLTTSYRVIDNTNSLVAISRSGNVGGGGGTLILRRPELVAIYSTTTTPGQQTNTEAQANTEADAYIALFQQKFANPNACEVEYPGIVPFTLDGNLAQVRWRAIHGSTPSTLVCEQEELDTGAVPKKRRRLDQLIEALAEAYL